MPEQENVDPLWDNRFRADLQDLASSGSTPLQPAAWVRQVHRRRRAAAAGVTGVLAAAVVVAGFALADPGETRQGLPAGPTEKPTGKPVLVPLTIPDGLDLPHEGETSPGGDVSDWVPTNMFSMSSSTGISWTYSPCDGYAVHTEDFGASDVRTIIQTSPEHVDSETLVVFPDREGAVRFVHSARTGAGACEPFASVAGGLTVSVAVLPGPWEEGVVVAETRLTAESTLEDPVYEPDVAYMLMARTGNAVTISQGWQAWEPAPETPLPQAVAHYRESLDEMAPKMCVFTVDGC